MLAGRHFFKPTFVIAVNATIQIMLLQHALHINVAHSIVVYLLYVGWAVTAVAGANK